MVQTANTVFRDFVTDNIPASGTWKPYKPDIRELLTYLENGVAGAAAGAVIFASKAAMDADLAYAADVMAWVLGDATAANNGVYQKQGASGSGSWTRLGDLPYGFIPAANAGAGTANAIVATTSIPLPDADGGALIALPIVANNTASPVTVAFNGAAALTIKTVSGNDIAIGGLTTGMIVAGYKSGTTFRLLSDQASAAIQAGAEAAQGYAEDWAIRPEDDPVPVAAGGDGSTTFSALHWAAKAAANAIDAYPATRTALGALDTTQKTVAYLLEEGREGAFKRVNTVEYSGWITADTRQAIIVQSTFDANFAWLRTGFDKMDLRWFGAPADGADSLEDGETVKGDWVTATAYVAGDLVWEASSGSRLGYICLVDHTSGTFATDLASGNWAVGAFTGTDNTAALQAMFALHEATGIPMLVPNGKFRCINPSEVVDSAFITLAGRSYDLEIQGDILIDDGLDAGANYNFFQTDTYDTNEDRSERDLFCIAGKGNFRGTWSHKPAGGSSTGRGHIFRLSGFKRITLTGFGMWDIAGKISRSRTNESVSNHLLHCERIASDSLRWTDTVDATIMGCEVWHADDDAINIHATDSGDELSICERIQIIGNDLYDIEGLICLGMRNGVVSGNTLKLTHGTCIYLGGRVGDEGDNAALNIVCVSNPIFDPLTRSNDGSTLSAASSESGAINVGSVQASWIAGAYNSGSGLIRDPLTAPGMVYYNSDLDTASVPQGGGMEVFGNPTRRTLPSVAKFSDWGFGLMFHSTGWIDPAVADTNFVTNGITLRSDIENFRVVPDVTGFRLGQGVFLHFLSADTYQRSWAFRNGRIAGGVVRDCRHGISHSLVAGTVAEYFVDVTVDGVEFDLDPYQVSPARTSATAGTWNSGATDPEKNAGIRMLNLYGMRVRGCKFMNLYEPIYGDATQSRADYDSNLVLCDPVSHAYDAGNLGVGVPYAAGPGFRHMIVDCLPTSADFGKVKNICRRGGSAVPTTGKYVIGHTFEVNMTGGIGVDRYRRATTGSNHVVATDWLAF
ncbi:hypothetical protein [Chelativorans alearense]|uniref:hypothetical protein n=1 Tax=Chelativorans alearense TaxID=2681495 RepID=UPI0013CFECA0|nr:hypothetical protein [Chelativorans alearense]